MKRTAALNLARAEALTAWRAVTGEIVVQPDEAVLGMLQVSWLRARLYAQQLEELQAEPPVDEAAAERLRRLTLLESEERDRCVRYAAEAHRMGIREAQIRLAERQGEAIVGFIGAVLRRLGLDPARPEVGAVIVEEMRVLNGQRPEIEATADGRVTLP